VKLIVFGASGLTGQLFVKQALQANHHVTAFVRNPARIPLKHERLTVVTGDALNRESVERAIIGHHAVVSCLGVSSLEPTSALSEMTANIVAGMTKYYVNRIVYTASAGIYGEIPGIFGWVAQRFLKNVLADHRQAVEHIQQSKLIWTIARPMGLTNEMPSGRYRTALTGVPPRGKRIARADVARFLLHALTDHEWEMKSVGLASK
jgi:uncharacterized protein YbjT (DUF2867 family)